MCKLNHYLQFPFAVLDVAQPTKPFHLVLCFELFSNTFCSFMLRYKCIKHFLSLFVDLGKIAVFCLC